LVAKTADWKLATDRVRQPVRGSEKRTEDWA